jgi:D-arabinose 1-dehydrogenase-like Zn-dependent alcohol dehydrogenase
MKAAVVPAVNSSWQIEDVPQPQLAVSVIELLFKRIKIIGSQQNSPEYLYEALDYVAQGKVKSIIETYPLAEAAKAYERVAEGKTRFRAVLTM